MIDQFQRTELLFGTEALQRIKQARVAVIGLGGVGSYAAEALARSGVGYLRLVDFDTVSLSNINRQLPALHSTVGQQKVAVMSTRLRDINPELHLDVQHQFFAQDTQDALLAELDFVVDAIDSLGPKAALMEACYRKQIPIISVFGAASRFDPAKIALVDISKTHTCPLARKIRKYLHRRAIHKGIPVLYSTEQPIPQFAHDMGSAQEWGNGRGRKRGTLGSVVYMPAIMGMWAASYVLRQLGRATGDPEATAIQGS
jgi:tRNA A37 threonylcarbamoyladenosine dehydratase